MTKILGGVLLIMGTSIGAAMLALPVVTSVGGFWNSIFLLLACWAIMTFCAFLVLEVNLWLPENSNLVSMAQTLLGRWGQIIAWLTYLLLFYALLAAYTAGGTSILQGLLNLVGISIPSWLTSLLFIALFGLIIYQGIKTVDYTNRLLMFIKLAVFVLLVAVALPHIQIANLPASQPLGALTSVTVIMTSFGYATIIPSLRSYFRGELAKLRWVIVLGSLIPLFLYSLWIFIIHSLIPVEGEHGLQAMIESGNATSQLTEALIVYLRNPWITSATTLFASISLITSFLGVALSVSDFLADGLRVKKIGLGNVIIYGATFIPPLVILLFYPNVFIAALKYAGIFCTILLVILPLAMAWVGRYHKQLPSQYQVIGGKRLLLIAGVGALIILAIGVWEVL